MLVRLQPTSPWKNRSSNYNHIGFFYVTNFGLSQEEVDRQFALGQAFYDLPLEEKLKYHSITDLERGEYNGYRPSGLRL
jgi:isopenicillin N synthase-like dioxygenase